MATDSNMPIQCHIAVMFWHIKNTNWFAPVAMASSRNANAKTPGGPGAARPQWSGRQTNLISTKPKTFINRSHGQPAQRSRQSGWCMYVAGLRQSPTIHRPDAIVKRNCRPGKMIAAWWPDTINLRGIQAAKIERFRGRPPSISISMVLDKSDSMRWGNVNIFREGG